MTDVVIVKPAARETDGAPAVNCPPPTADSQPDRSRYLRERPMRESERVAGAIRAKWLAEKKSS